MNDVLRLQHNFTQFVAEYFREKQERITVRLKILYYVRVASR